MTDIYAWIGEDEFGSGRVGIKRGIVPAGNDVPLVAMDYDRVKMERLRPQLQTQARMFGKVIRLARFTFAEDVITLLPDPVPPVTVTQRKCMHAGCTNWFEVGLMDARIYCGQRTCAAARS